MSDAARRSKLHSIGAQSPLTPYLGWGGGYEVSIDAPAGPASERLLRFRVFRG